MTAEPPPAPPRWLAELPARAAERDPSWFSRYLATGSDRTSAVLVLVAPGAAEGEERVILTERAATLRHHAGQISFPGGRIEPEDGTPEAAALREGHEEVGIEPSSVTVLGLLPALHIPVTRFDVVPVVAWWHHPGVPTAQHPGEVARVLDVPVAALVDPANRVTARHPSGHSTPGFTVEGALVWGFTGGVLDRVLDLAGLSVPWDRSRVVPVG